MLNLKSIIFSAIICFHLLEGYRVLKGTVALIFVYQIHRDERYYPEPEKFIPERFLPENSANRHPYAFVPFSAGRRNCIGQRFAMLEYKLFVANLLRNYALSCDQTVDDVILEVKLILRTENPIIFKLSPRLTE
jgi:cytochrome P450 family 4